MIVLLHPTLGTALLLGGTPHKQCLQDYNQHKIIRYLTYSPPMTNVSDKYKSLKIMDTKSLYFFEVAKFMHSVYHKSIPNAFDDYFHTISHQYNTRNREMQMFSLPQPRTERGKRSLRYKGIEVWGKVPQHLKAIEPNTFTQN